MKIHHGIDIIEKSRIKKIYQKYGIKFLKKILTNDEISFFEKFKNKNNRKLELLAGSFSAKESFAKAVGYGFRNGLKFSHIEVIRKENKRPYFKISDYAKLLLKKKLIEYKNYDLSLSISHNHKTVISSVTILFF
jgi:holo-[acyl-carrier protein] synthase